MTQNVLLACKNGLGEICYEQAINQKIRLRYTLSQELSLLRQKDAKPQEFAAYDAYAQACKEEVKAEFSAAGIVIGADNDTEDEASSAM